MSLQQAIDHRPDDRVAFEIQGKKQRASYTWFRGEHCNYNPAGANMLAADSVRRHVLHGWTPPTPLIGPSTAITAFGSCFAANISKWLSRRKFSVLTSDEGSKAYVVRFGEGMVTTFALRQQFEWAFEGKRPQSDVWHDYSAQSQAYDEGVREETRRIFDKTEVFVLTLGLSEVWYEKATGEVLWRAPPASHDSSLYAFRLSSVEENAENLRAIYRLIRKYRPDAKLIVTLSPIPLVATFRPVSCISANSVSKAVLRVAVDLFHREVAHEGVAFYWPSYEIVMDVFGDRWKEDRRHVKGEILRFIMVQFEDVWCHGVVPEVSLAEAWAAARASAGSLPPPVLKALETRNGRQMARIAKRFAKARRGDPQDVDFLKQLAATL